MHIGRCQGIGAQQKSQTMTSVCITCTCTEIHICTCSSIHKYMCLHTCIHMTTPTDKQPCPCSLIDTWILGDSTCSKPSKTHSCRPRVTFISAWRVPCLWLRERHFATCCSLHRPSKTEETHNPNMLKSRPNHLCQKPNLKKLQACDQTSAVASAAASAWEQQGQQEPQCK